MTGERDVRQEGFLVKGEIASGERNAQSIGKKVERVGPPDAQPQRGCLAAAECPQACSVELDRAHADSVDVSSNSPRNASVR